MRRWMRIIARLYPAGWRARYGDEFDALLEDVRPGGRYPRRRSAAATTAAGTRGGGSADRLILLRGLLRVLEQEVQRLVRLDVVGDTA
jgi:hypothetical protein